MSKLSEIQSDSSDRIKENADRNDKFEKSDKMWHVQWDMPSSLEKLDWIVPCPTSDPHDQMLSGISLLANNKETRHFNPYNDSPKAQDLADRVEKALAWNFHQATRRRATPVITDMISSAVRYGSIFYEVVFLPFQQKTFGFTRKREKAIKRFGNMAYVMHNPKTVYPRFSDYMLESVLCVQTMDTQKALDFFGEKLEKYSDDLPDEITVYDYWDIENRAVWWNSEGGVEGGQAIIDPEGKEGKHGLPFIPWVCQVGGTTLEDDPEHQYVPLCYATTNNNAWNVQNIARTLVMSKAITQMSSPNWSATGPGAEEVQITYGSPDVHIVAPNAETRIQQHGPIPLDQGLLSLVNIFRVDMDKSSLSALMQGGAMPSGTAYATYNIKMQSDMSRLYPYRAIAQEAIADGDVLTMQWHKHRGTDLVGYGMKKDDRNKKYLVKPQEYDMDALHIEVELNPDMPIDRNQRINGAINMYERLGVSREECLSELGFGQPDDIERKRMFEQLEDALTQAEVKRIMSQVDLQVQQEMAKFQAGLQAQMQAQAQANTGPTPQQQPQPGAPQGLPPQAGGFNNNPAQGAPSPQEAFPFATREEQTGMSRSGEEGFTPGG